MASFLNSLAKTVLNRIFKEGLNKIFKKQPEPTTQPSKPEPPKNHPWRLCPLGEHWVRTHPLTLPPTQKLPERMTTRRGHCRHNVGAFEVYTTDELQEVANLYFHTLLQDPEVMPIPDALDFPNGNKFDSTIAGWTKFWNEVLKPSTPITPDFIKALIATESGFVLPKDISSKDGSARGLIQITENTRNILQDRKGEIRNHYIEMTIEESRIPEVNIGAGIRWLHHKKYLAEHRLKREITWEEAAAEYKGILSDLGRDEKSDRIMRELRKYHLRLKSQRTQK